ncbi:methylated-DNA--[protein]-cysteine S-methyltransferase [Rhodococcus sp. NPDC127528]|uniref:methylated-DNA--[protein]-cysteine S-methyltransferase n=1 Tax=unclassified Rhodococcus (in: high G+C Gram-positive bacteria) TaxID=192944 RepID=UPI00363BB314
MNTRHIVVDSDLGSITVVARGEAISGLYFRHHIRRPSPDTFGQEMSTADDRLLDEASRQLRDYLAGRRCEFDLPLIADGDTFQSSVWGIVQTVPFGSTITYGRIAERLGDRSLAQKVGQAVGANPLCIFVPCHRVVGSNGSLTGYAGGLERKRALLELEEPAHVSAGRLF